MRPRLVKLMSESLYVVWMLFTIACVVQTFVGILNGTSPYGVAIFFTAFGGLFLGFVLTRWAYERRIKIMDKIWKSSFDDTQNRINEARKRIAPLQKKAVESFKEFMAQASAGNPEGAQAAADNVHRLNELIDVVIHEQFYVDPDNKEEEKK